MPVNSLDDAVSGFQAPCFFYKVASPSLTAGRPFSPIYLAGIPGAAVAPSPGMGGAALTSYAGQLWPSVSATGGVEAYLGRLACASNATTGQVLLVDRLWHNSGINVTLTTSQTINSVAWPARDINGSTNGEGVLIGIEVSTATGAGTPTITLTYTNSDGVAGRTAIPVVAPAASSYIGSFYPFGLQAGDKGVRSIQSIQLASSWSSGAVHLVAYRVLASLSVYASHAATVLDLISSGKPRMYDGTVPGTIFIPGGSAATQLYGQLTITQK